MKEGIRLQFGSEVFEVTGILKTKKGNIATIKKVGGSGRTAWLKL